MPSEFATRKEIIDLRLKEAGWNVADRTQVIEEFFVPPCNEGGECGKSFRARDAKHVWHPRT